LPRRRKNKNTTPDLSAEWEKLYSVQINGRTVIPGTELRIRGERGRFRFIKYVKTPAGAEWIDVWGGPKNCEQWRSFRLDRVRTVHYKNQTVKNLAAEYKEKIASRKEEENNAS
jgi:hypothetical protein